MHEQLSARSEQFSARSKESVLSCGQTTISVDEGSKLNEAAQTLYSGATHYSGATPRRRRYSKESGVDLEKLIFKTLPYPLLVGFSYTFLSTVMIFYNKHLMHDSRFPYSAALVSMQMLFMLIMCIVMRYFQPSAFPAVDVIDTMWKRGAISTKRIFMTFFFIGACSTGATVLGNTALRYAAVSFLQMIKEANLVNIYFLSVIFGLQSMSGRQVSVVIFVVCCAMVAVGKSATFSSYGFLLQGAGSFCGALQVVVTQSAMVNLHGISVDPMSMILLFAPMSLLTLVPLNFATYDPEIIERLKIWWPQIAGNMVLAVVLQIASTVAIRDLSATGHTMASMIKDVTIVIIASVSLGEATVPLQIAGFVGIVCGTVMFSMMKLFPELASASSPFNTPHTSRRGSRSSRGSSSFCDV